jgi:hypothetical protein
MVVLRFNACLVSSWILSNPSNNEEALINDLVCIDLLEDQVCKDLTGDHLNAILTDSEDESTSSTRLSKLTKGSLASSQAGLKRKRELIDISNTEDVDASDEDGLEALQSDDGHAGSWRSNQDEAQDEDCDVAADDDVDDLEVVQKYHAKHEEDEFGDKRKS